jgi:phage-related protein
VEINDSMLNSGKVEGVLRRSNFRVDYESWLWTIGKENMEEYALTGDNIDLLYLLKTAEKDGVKVPKWIIFEKSSHWNVRNENCFDTLKYAKALRKGRSKWLNMEKRKELMNFKLFIGRTKIINEKFLMS